MMIDWLVGDIMLKGKNISWSHPALKALLMPKWGKSHRIYSELLMNLWCYEPNGEVRWLSLKTRAWKPVLTPHEQKRAKFCWVMPLRGFIVFVNNMGQTWSWCWGRSPKTCVCPDQKGPGPFIYSGQWVYIVYRVVDVYVLLRLPKGIGVMEYRTWPIDRDAFGRVVVMSYCMLRLFLLLQSALHRVPSLCWATVSMACKCKTLRYVPL